MITMIQTRAMRFWRALDAILIEQDQNPSTFGEASQFEALGPEAAAAAIIEARAARKVAA